MRCTIEATQRLTYLTTWSRCLIVSHSCVQIGDAWFEHTRANKAQESDKSRSQLPHNAWSFSFECKNVSYSNSIKHKFHVSNTFRIIFLPYCCHSVNAVRGVILLYSENLTKPVKTLCERNEELLLEDVIATTLLQRARFQWSFALSLSRF
jgi:hypothetical protein